MNTVTMLAISFPGHEGRGTTGEKQEGLWIKSRANGGAEVRHTDPDRAAPRLRAEGGRCSA
jgi:hypothetical protein